MVVDNIRNGYPKWRRWTIIVLYVVIFFGLPVAGLVYELISPGSHEVYSNQKPVTQISVYNSKTRDFRIEHTDTYVRKDGDTDTEVGYTVTVTKESYHWRVVFLTSTMILGGILYLRILKRDLYG